MVSTRPSPFVHLAIILAVSIAIGGSLPSAALSQESTRPTMPANWQSLAAAEFLQAAETLFGSSLAPTTAHTAEVVTHGWNSFLNDVQFVSGSDWTVVRGMATLFVDRRTAMVSGQTPDEVTASREQVEANLATLKTRLEQRLAAEPGIATAASFAELQATDEALGDSQFTNGQRAALFTDWMDAHDWQTLTLAQQAFLYRALDDDQLNPQQLSVRWTGSLEVPATGQYTFEQLRQYHADGALKLWLDGQLVLDTMGLSAPADGEPSRVYLPVEPDARFRSTAVSLTAGQPIALRAELVYDEQAMLRVEPYPERRFPMAVLLWQRDSLSAEIIPASAYSPPEGFGAAGSPGLKGEYFADTTLTDLKATRLDPGLQLIWKDAAVAGVHHDRQATIFAEVQPKLVDDVFLGGLDEAGRAALVNDAAPRLAAGMTAVERAQLAAKFALHEPLLAAATPHAVAGLVSQSHLLPGQEHLALLAAWGQAHTPRAQIGAYASSPEGHEYHATNYESSNYIGELLYGPFWGDSQALLANELENDNGQCNLSIANILAFSFRLQGHSRDLRDRLQQALDDETLTGDARVPWLLARAYAEEVFIDNPPRSIFGLPHVEEAFAAAETTEVRFWALEELVARLISNDRGQQAKSLLDSVSAQFTAPEQQAAIAAWRARADELTSYYVQVREEAAASTVGRDIYVKQLRRRLARAQDRGDDAIVARYQQLIQAAMAQ